MRAMLWLGLGGTRPVKLGAGSVVPRELLMELLRRRLTDDDRDVVLLRVSALKEGRGVRFQLIDFGEPKKGISAMMKTTAFPAAAVAWMLGSGKIVRKGALPQELCIPPGDFLDELERRGIRLVQDAV
jgi:saccharopine dehydrogenase-like NADP-dependent oxidoreductase